MDDSVKITALGQTYRYQGKGYGPFSPTPERPYIEVPLPVALASGAPAYTGEPVELPTPTTDLQAQVDALKAERNDLTGKLTDALADVERLRGQIEASTAAVQANTEAVEASTPLPDDFPMRALLAEHGFDTVAKVKAGLAKANGAEKSPVENISGIGPATLKAIEAALK